ncbi:MAG: repeat-containing protein [Pedosphaera sp.]|nr:repeat-containing protein [Pedosphaera sp.]
MRKRFRILFALIALAVVGGIVWAVIYSHEPVYQGKGLSAWLEDLDDPHPGPKKDRAEEAVRHIGRDAMPEIIRILKRRDSSLKERSMKWLSEHHFFKAAYHPVIESQSRALRACSVLGPQAKAAIPAMVSLVNESSHARWLEQALVQAGPDAVAPLIGALTNRDYQVRRDVAYRLWRFPNSGPKVMPVLIECLKDKSLEVRVGAVFSMGELKQEPIIAIPALMAMLEDTTPSVRWRACLAIGKYEHEAQAATAALLTALSDPDPSVSGTAAIALVQINPEDASIIAKAMPFLTKDLLGIAAPTLRMRQNFRSSAIRVMGRLGKQAEPAVPALIECLKDEDDYVREAAGKALKEIDPEAAAKAGVK